MKRKWLWIPVALLAVLVVLLTVFWQSFAIYLFPKTVLAAALADTVSSFESKFQAGPVAVLAQGLDSQGNTVALKLDTNNERLGSIRYEMDLQLEHKPRRIRGQGQAILGNKTLDLEIYMDGTFVALSSSGLLQGRFYGVDYDSFAHDLESNRLLTLFLGYDTVGKWKDKVTDLNRVMNTSTSVPEVTQLDSGKLIAGLMALEAEVEKEELLIEGVSVPCYEISFETTGAQILEGLRYLGTSVPFSIDPNAEINVSFFLQKDILRKVELTADSDTSETEIHLLIGTYDTKLLIKDPLGYREIFVHTDYDDSWYRETVSVNQARSGVKSQMQMEYAWDRSNGSANVSVTKNLETTDLSINLRKGEKGFLLECNDFEGLMHILINTPDSGNSPCKMEVSKGAQVITPEYKSFREWSMDDMLVLLSGLGDLLGLKAIE